MPYGIRLVLRSQDLVLAEYEKKTNFFFCLCSFGIYLNMRASKKYFLA